MEKADLLRAKFEPLMTELDELSEGESLSWHRPTIISGYTEWLSKSVPTLTLGWDWVMDSRERFAKPRRQGPPRTNVCLLASDGRPMDWELSLHALSDMVDTVLPWIQAVHALSTSRLYSGIHTPDLRTH